LSGSKRIGQVTPPTWALMNSTITLSKVYDNGDVEIFSVSHA